MSEQPSGHSGVLPIHELLVERQRLDIEIRSRLSDSTKVLGHNVRRLREERGWTQAELADRINLGRASVANIEGGTQSPPWPTLCLLADVLGTSLDLLREAPADDL